MGEFAVLGSPISHSLSPQLHRAAAAAIGLTDFRYGRIEIDETVEDGARREVREECGLAVGQLELLGIFSGPRLHHVYPTSGNEVSGVDIVYLSRDYTGALHCADGEAGQMGFYPIDALPRPIFPMNAPALEEYLRRRGVEVTLA